LFPDSVLCGSDEYIPGIKDGYLPNNSNIKAIDLTSVSTFVISDMRVAVGEDFEGKLLENMKSKS